VYTWKTDMLWLKQVNLGDYETVMLSGVYIKARFEEI